jgi:hypothetical protein
MKRGVEVILALLVAAFVMAGCGGSGGGGKGNLTPREQGMKSTYEGSYQVKGKENGEVQGVGIYSNGSFHVLQENVPRVIIHNQQSGENWVIDLTLKSYQAVTYDEALVKAGFLPSLSMKGYFELDQYWMGNEFRMDTADGRSIRAYLDGPDYLPTLWEAESNGKVFKDMSWEYVRVNQVSQDNFKLPEGLTEKG